MNVPYHQPPINQEEYAVSSRYQINRVNHADGSISVVDTKGTRDKHGTLPTMTFHVDTEPFAEGDRVEIILRKPTT